MKMHRNKIFFGFLLISVVIIPSWSSLGIERVIINDLDDFYKQDTFSIRIDQNSGSETENAIHFIKDLYNNVNFNDSIDSDEFNNDIYSMAFDKTEEFYTMFLGLEKMTNYVNLSEYSYPSFSFRNYLPYTKLLNYFTLNNYSEDILLSQDFLGLALKVNGSSFPDNRLLMGYPNIPLEVVKTIDLVTERKQTIFPRPDVESTFSKNDQMVEISISYSNISFIFQAQKIGVNSYSDFSVKNTSIIMLLDKLEVKYEIRAFHYEEFWTLEVTPHFIIGNIIEMAIGERIENDLNDFITEKEIIVEPISILKPISFGNFTFYRDSAILDRINQFDTFSLNVMTSQNINVNGSQVNLNEPTFFMDEIKQSSLNLREKSIEIDKSIKAKVGDYSFYHSVVEGNNFALLTDKNTNSNSFIKISEYILPWSGSETSGMDNFALFQEENELVMDLVADFVQRIYKDQYLGKSSGEVLITTRMSFFDTDYILNYEVSTWTGDLLEISPKHILIKEKTDMINNPLEKITNSEPIFSIFSIIIIYFIRDRRKKGKEFQDY